jgi:pimeloyl-ACP methyl ester carboxylesterase
MPPDPAPGIGRAFVATAGTGFPVLLLHQTPHSWDDDREVLPLLGGRFRAIAMDTPGFGDSPRFEKDAPSIERSAATTGLGPAGSRWST